MKKQVLWALFTRAGSVILNVLGTILAARALNLEDRGQFYYLQALATTILQFVNLGLHYTITYQYCRNKELLGPLIGNALLVSIPISIVVTTSVLACLAHTGNLFGFPLPLLAVSVLLPTCQLLMIYGQVFWLALGEVPIYSRYALLQDCLNLLAFFLSWAVFRSSTGMIGLLVVGGTACNFLMWRELVVKCTTPIQIDLQLYWSSLGYSMRTFITSLQQNLFSRGHIFLAKSVFGTASVGTLSMAVQCADLLAVFPQSIALVLFPNLVKQQENKLQTTLKTMMVVSPFLLVSCLLAGLLAKHLIPLVFGAQYGPAAPLLTLMLPGAFFWALSCLLSQYYNAVGIPYSTVVYWLVALLAYAGLVGLNWPVQSLDTLAWIYSAACFILLVLQFAFLRTAKESEPT